MNPQKAGTLGPANRLLREHTGLTVRQYRRILMGVTRPDTMPSPHPEHGACASRAEADARISEVLAELRRQVVAA